MDLKLIYIGKPYTVYAKCSFNENEFNEFNEYWKGKNKIQFCRACQNFFHESWHMSNFFF